MDKKYSMTQKIKIGEKKIGKMAKKSNNIKKFFFQNISDNHIINSFYLIDFSCVVVFLFFENIFFQIKILQ